MDLSFSQVFGVATTICIGVIGWFIKRIFNDIQTVDERSRNNERDLYVKLAQTREEMLRLEIERLKSIKSS